MKALTRGVTWRSSGSARIPTVAGLSIEDATGDDEELLFEIDTAVNRVRAARATRMKLYVEAGADCGCAPGIRTREEIAAVVAEVAPKPIDLLVGYDSSRPEASAADP